jgi:hypothetical protein
MMSSMLEKEPKLMLMKAAIETTNIISTKNLVMDSYRILLSIFLTTLPNQFFLFLEHLTKNVRIIAIITSIHTKRILSKEFRIMFVDSNPSSPNWEFTGDCTNEAKPVMYLVTYPLSGFSKFEYFMNPNTAFRSEE